ncbi:hypothetical protein POPTR_002G034700v4 [Populus trichocarpa]|uniref:Uncharacterized protein n=1 Tax=Populus trichocarpa TaxID=3694 RepID=A0ACC0TBV7_POPTR|nr:uncharacterized protein LOC7479738 [Populus trichocarpa]KAI5596905.1 hypothetical protein BDE02_02G032900 [Populus trichocarpa]KAI9399001.1 hypothetical protein POPTR_002G034700v4 [Populus trichocarpa]
MADQRPFRFRLPWLSAPVAPPLRPTAEPQPPRPRVEIQAPARPITTIPIQRPPFRPAGITPATTPTTQTTAQEQTEPQPVPPRRAAIESQVNAQPVSQSRETRAASVPPSQSRETPQSRAASVPPSPSRAKTQSQAAPQTQSPSRATPQSRAASVAPSPSRTTSQPQSAAAVTVPQTQSPSRLATQVPGRKSPQLSSPSKTATQVQPTVSQSPSKKLQLATQEISQPPPKSTQSDTQQEETKPTPAAEPVQASDAVTAPTPTPEPALETPASLQKSDSRTIGADHPMPLSQPVKRVKEDIFERKKTTTISPNGETIKTARTRSAFGESHQKTSMSSGEKVPLQKEIREDISKFVHNLGMEHMEHPIGEKPVSVVTLAGENRGATMYVGSESSRKDGSVHIHRGYKINPDESSEATTDGEGSSRGRSSKDLLTKEDPARKAYINSNTQSVNNSILFETSVSERSPGVQLSLSYNDEEPSKNSSKPVRLETRKAEFQVTPAEKLSYEPKVRRRCLRGLFLESSDSDPDNPEKPRRHGCRYSCGQKRKDKDIGVL